MSELVHAPSAIRVVYNVQNAIRTDLKESKALEKRRKASAKQIKRIP